MTSQLQERTSTNETKQVEIWCGIKVDVAPAVGSCVRLGDSLATAKMGERLLDGDDFYTDDGYDGCDFRFPISATGPIKDVACNVKVTGRKTTRRFGDEWVRVTVEFVGDCEPSTFVKGFMLIDETTSPKGF